ncbi:hypothetical protein ACW0US_17620 [Xanthomonas euvesicatoria]
MKEQNIPTLQSNLDRACSLLEEVAKGSEAAGRWLDDQGDECDEDTPGASWHEYSHEEQTGWLLSVAAQAQQALELLSAEGLREALTRAGSTAAAEPAQTVQELTHEEIRAWRAVEADEVGLVEIRDAGGMAGIRSGPLETKEALQDLLDHTLQKRAIAVRNELRELGWDGEKFKPLTLLVGDTTVVFEHRYEHVGYGKNIASIDMTFRPAGTPVDQATVIPELMLCSAREMAGLLHQAVAINHGNSPDIDPAKAIHELQSHLNQAQLIWERLPAEERDRLNDAIFPNEDFGPRLDVLKRDVQDMSEHLDFASANRP